MRNVQVIDSAQNCSYSVYEVVEADFVALFNRHFDGQDVCFVEDLIDLYGETEAGSLLVRATRRRLDKQKITGIHGTLFVGLGHRRVYFPTRGELDLDAPLSVDDEDL